MSANDLTITVRTDPGGREPTRYQVALRRQAANRARRRHGEKPLPEVVPGNCGRCGGWGLERKGKRRCSACAGSGWV